jgi:dTDP-4-dehydrorhamnose 3,5-epimerase
MQVVKTDIEGLFILEPKIFGDHRGYFLESFNEKLFSEVVGKKIMFVQDNESLSSRNVVRGLHFQNPPFAQGKLVRVVKGSVLDVAVDLRKKSSTFGKVFTIELSETNKRQFWIPEGFAHGFATLEDNTIFQYKCTSYYSPENEGTIKWDDEKLGIDWKINEPIVSDKDKKGLPFDGFNSPFE